MRILVPLAEGFEEIEAVNVIDILRRADVEVVTAGLKEGLVQGSHKISVLPDTSLNKIDFRDFDGLVLPGGSPGFINLGNDERILTAAREMDKAGKYVGGDMRGAIGPHQGRSPARSQSHGQPFRQGPGGGVCRILGRSGGGGQESHHQPLSGDGPGVRPSPGGGLHGQGEDAADQRADAGPLRRGLEGGSQSTSEIEGMNCPGT